MSVNDVSSNVKGGIRCMSTGREGAAMGINLGGRRKGGAKIYWQWRGRDGSTTTGANVIICRHE